VSFTKDKSVMKKAVKEGSGYDTPKDASKAKLSVINATDGSATLPRFETKVLEFTVGDGEVCDALECAVAEMKKAERAEITVSNVVLAAEAQLGLKDVMADRVVLTMELLEFENAKDTWSLSEEEKVDFGTKRKDMGSIHFKNGRLQLALQRYKKVADMFNYIDNFREENKVKAKELKKNCDLNSAACHLKLKNYADAKMACATVLKDDTGNIKALYRRAQAECGLKNFMECISDCKKIITANPQNKEARALLKEASAGQKLCDKQAKGLFANMCKALGKGPIPEPYKAKRGHEKIDEDDDNEKDNDGDEAMETAGTEEEKKADAEAVTVGDGAADVVPDVQMQDASGVGQAAAAAA